MKTRERADSVAELVHTFAKDRVASGDKIEAVAADMISAILHLVTRTHEMGGDDGRKHALAAARTGLSGFISDMYSTPREPTPACYTLITVRTDGGLWVSETGFEEMIQ
ncbi:hypothetical protein [Rhizobium sp. Leaf386]|uniref:hypothetical protein n=1 Tax=Rhizobium sp. Leaf386 TaxID=1736359 RepID=UPI0007139668|nr:hypothetical protein [Rhizobium sp. Leaf386]KQS95374.1 hypothetical protein ASG50_25450 [Rhizobium sp. Leaf386]